MCFKSNRYENENYCNRPKYFSNKSYAFNDACELLYRVNIPHHQIYPHAGWVEHDAVEIYQNMLKAISCVLEQDDNKEESTYSLAITNQRETVVVWG